MTKFTTNKKKERKKKKKRQESLDVIIFTSLFKSLGRLWPRKEKDLPKAARDLNPTYFPLSLHKF